MMRNGFGGDSHFGEAILLNDVVASGQAEAMDFGGRCFDAVYFSGRQLPVSGLVPVGAARDGVIGESL